MTPRAKKIYSRMIQILDEENMSGRSSDEVRRRAIARILDELLPVAAGEQGRKAVHKWNPPNQILCGAAIDGTNMYTDGHNNMVTCPDCLKLMRDGTGKDVPHDD